MTGPHEPAGVELGYQAREDSAPRHGRTLALLFGATATMCATVIVGATLIEESRIRAWQGPEVVGLWACLVLTVLLAPAGLFLSIRAVKRPATRTRAAWLASALSASALLLLLYFLVHIS